MIQRLLYIAGMMLIIFPAWSQTSENNIVLDEAVVEAIAPHIKGGEKSISVHPFSMEKLDRMPILKPGQGFNSNMAIATLPPDVQAKMPIYNDLPAQKRELPELNQYHTPKGLGGSLEGYKDAIFHLPKLEAPYTYSPMEK